MTTINGSHVVEYLSEMATWCRTKTSLGYVKVLSVADKRRYLEKTNDTGDPYAYTLSILDQEDLPPVMAPDIFNYIVITTRYCTSERFKVYKSMDAYKYFINGFVSSVAARRVRKNFVVVGKVSQILKIQFIDTCISQSNTKLVNVVFIIGLYMQHKTILRLLL